MPNIRVNNRDRWIMEGVRAKTLDAGYDDIFKRKDETTIELYVVLLGLIQYRLLQNGYGFEDISHDRDELVLRECVNFANDIIGKKNVLKFSDKEEVEELSKWVDWRSEEKAKIFTWLYRMYAKLLEEE